MKKIKPSFTPAICWFIISTVLLTLPGSSLPKEDWFGKIWFDKWVHVVIFSIMVSLWCWAMLNKNYENKTLKKKFIGMALLWLAYGIGMEFVQKYFIPGRSYDVGDIIADAAGCAMGVVYSIRRYIKKIDPCGNRGRNQN